MYTQNNDSLINFLEKYSLQKHIKSLEEDPSLLSILFTRSAINVASLPSFYAGRDKSKILRIDNIPDNKITDMIRDLARILHEVRFKVRN